AWLSQANHMFHRLQITSNHDDYCASKKIPLPFDVSSDAPSVLIYRITYHLDISAQTRAPPNGYLFVCPKGHLQTGQASFRLPDCPAYWSTDPSGVERLSADEAASLGFPSIRPTTALLGYACDAAVYVGLHQFHRAKGFNPDSQDVARYLGYRLYQL
ncbi:hypothetical protein C8J57DRAFT_1016861, partial [Mycena rebaudengoi]